MTLLFVDVAAAGRDFRSDAQTDKTQGQGEENGRRLAGTETLSLLLLLSLFACTVIDHISVDCLLFSIS